MPNITSISKTMRTKRTNIPQDVLAKLGFDAVEYKFISNEHSFDKLVEINDLLTCEQKYAVMEQQGCHKGGRMDKESKAFAEEHADKSFAERLKVLSIEDEGLHINDDGTISLQTCEVDNNDVARGCQCLKRDNEMKFNSFIEEYPDKASSFSQFHCGCCAGHQKHHLQNKLGVKLKLKSIGTSVSKTGNGQKRIFIYEVTQ